MSDAIEYCDRCPIQVGCHMERQCLRPKCSNCGDPATYRALHREAGTVRICEDCRKTHRGDHTEIMQIWPPAINDTPPPPSDDPEANNAAPAGCMARLVRRLHCAIMGHRCYLWADDGKTFLPVRISDDSVVATCARCGDTLSAVCAIYLPGMRYKAPKNNLLLGVERMSEAQCSSPSTPGGDLTADEPQYDWRTRHDSYLKYLYVENPPKLVWNGEEWIPETNA